MDGKRSSIEVIISIFDDFVEKPGLKIIIEKSTLYLAGISDQIKADITSSFPFATGQLSVRYLGLPLLTKRMNTTDYMPLVEGIRLKMSSWITRFLSYAERLQLLYSVITSLVNFWIAAYRLPNGCVKRLRSFVEISYGLVRI